MSWQNIWNRLRAVPAGLWAALGVALTILTLYLRGKRLQGELAKARLDEEAARAKFKAAEDLGKSMVHFEEAEDHAKKATKLQDAILIAEQHGAEEQKRIHALPASKITDEYLKLLKEHKP